MAKETKDKIYETPLHVKVMSLLKENGYSDADFNKVAISVNNKDDIARVKYDYTSTGIHFNNEDLTQSDVEAAGFQYWHTWHWGDNN